MTTNPWMQTELRTHKTDPRIRYWVAPWTDDVAREAHPYNVVSRYGEQLDDVLDSNSWIVPWNLGIPT